MNELPAGWSETKLGDPFVWGSGGTPLRTTSNYYGGGIPWVIIGDLDDGPVSRTSETISQSGLAESSAKWVAEGSVLVAMYGSIGKLGIAAIPLTTNQAIAFTQPPSGISNRYLFYYLMSRRSALLGEGKGGTQSNISQTVIKAFPFVCAPSAEQPRIVDAIDSYVSRLDAAVATLEAAHTKLKAYRTSVLKTAVEGRLVPTEAALAQAEKRDFEPADLLLKRMLSERRWRWEEVELAKLKAAGKSPRDEKWKARYEEPKAPDKKELPALPEGWCWASVDQVGDVLLGRQRAPQYLTGQWSHPYLRVANIKDDHIDLDDVEEMDFDDAHFVKYQLRPGDILVSEGQSPHLVGQSAIYSGGIEGLCFQKTLHRFRAIEGGPTSEFAQLVFRAHVRMRVFQKVASITTNIAHLTLEKFKESRFPLPPAAEQERIFLEAERLLSVADAVENQVTMERSRIRRLRQAVLKWAFEGKLVDQDPNDEPAEELLERIRAERANGETPKRAGRARNGQ